jgi:Flp pilus assembly protein TadD
MGQIDSSCTRLWTGYMSGLVCTHRRNPTSSLVHMTSDIDTGRVYGDQGNYAVALERFEKALEVDPLNSTALQLRVTALRELRRFAEAESAAHSAIETRPHEPDLLVELG